MLAAAGSTRHGARCALHTAQDEDARHSESPDHGPHVSMEVDGETLTGMQIGGNGEYTNARGYTYRGQAREAMADGFGVLTYPNADTCSGEWSAGVRHGHAVYHNTDGDVGYWLHDRGSPVHYAHVRVNGTCDYHGQRCAAADALLLALVAAALDAAVRRTTRRRLAGRSRSSYATLSRCAAVGTSACFFGGARADSFRGRRARSKSPQRRRRRSRCAAVTGLKGRDTRAHTRTHTLRRHKQTGIRSNGAHACMSTSVYARTHSRSRMCAARGRTHTHTQSHAHAGSARSHAHTDGAMCARRATRCACGCAATDARQWARAAHARCSDCTRRSSRSVRNRACLGA
jgi:hypothetical protein